MLWCSQLWIQGRTFWKCFNSFEYSNFKNLWIPKGSRRLLKISRPGTVWKLSYIIMVLYLRYVAIKFKFKACRLLFLEHFNHILIRPTAANICLALLILMCHCMVQHNVLDYNSFVCNIAVFLLKMDVKLQPTDYSSFQWATRMWANGQRDIRLAEYRWRPLFNAAKFGCRPLLECRAVMLPRCETCWNLLWCIILANRSQPLVGRSSPYCEDMWWRHCCLTSFFRLSIRALVAKI